MKKDKAKRVPKHIQQLCNSLEKLFDLVNFERLSSIALNDNDHNSAMKIEIDREYRRYYLTYFPGFFTADKDLQRKYLLHEFCHVFTTEMLQQLDDLRSGKFVTPEEIRRASERATSRITTLCHDLLVNQWSGVKKEYKKYLDA